MQKPDVVDEARHGMWRNKDRLRQMRAWGEPEVPAMLHVARVNFRNVSAPPRVLVKSSRVVYPIQRGARVCPRGFCLLSE